MSHRRPRHPWFRLRPDRIERIAPPRAGRFAWGPARLEPHFLARVTLAAALVVSPVAHAAPDPACLLAKADRYAAAQIEWQRTIADLVVAEAPAMRATAFAWRDDQIDRIELRRLAVGDRLRADPATMNEDKVIAHWLEFGPREQAELVLRDPRAAEVAARIKARPAPPPAEYQAFRSFVQERMAKSDAYRRSLARMDATIAAASAVACPG